MRKLLLALFSIITIQLSATHIVGGELNYTYLGNNQYLVKLTVYRDCSPNVTTDFDNPAFIGIFNSSGVLIDTLSLPFTGRIPINPIFTVPCGTAPTNVCVEYTIYQATVTLPSIPGGYFLQYQRCCRNNSIINITTPGDVGATYTAQIPEFSIVGANSNPIISNPPPVYACAGLPLSQNFGAFDGDGDSLVYSLCVPNTGADGFSPQPPPESYTPITPVTWASGYNLSNIMGGSFPITINPSTGLLTGTPQSLGQFVFTVCVSEYRNGQLLSVTRRDMQFNVVDCQITVISAFTTPQGTCGNIVNFQNNSTGANTFSWDFGVNSITTDTSTQSSPSYTYPAPGTYTVTLIAIDTINGSNCNDTLNIDITVQPPYAINAGPDAAFCTGLGATIGPAGPMPNTTFQWSPSTGLDNPSIQNPQASPSITTTYILTAINSQGCNATDTVSVFIGQFPATVVDTNLTGSCAGWSLTLGAPSLGSGYAVSWQFTDGVLLSGTPVTRNFSFGDTISVFAYFIDQAGSCSDTIFYSQLLPPISLLFQEPIPNVFTPNGDAFNECYQPNILPGFETCYTMTVYNRWGRKVFETDVDHTCWNGKIQSDGSEASEGVYFYIMQLNGEKTYNGTVLLTRGK